VDAVLKVAKSHALIMAAADRNSRRQTVRPKKNRAETFVGAGGKGFLLELPDTFSRFLLPSENVANAKKAYESGWTIVVTYYPD
jgi:hypothetical protein